MVGKVAVIGNADFVMPFSTLGVDTYPVGDTTDQIIENANKIISERYALVVIAENIAPVVEEAFAPLTNAPTPAVLVVPFTTESKGFATRALGQVLKTATGINILQNR